jgi:hypothetical protein
MLNGLTISKGWQSTYEYNRKCGTFRVTVIASFGFGVRIPWQADVEVSPSRIPCPAVPDKTPFEAAIKINTLDANADFYRALGLPENQIHDGQEFVARAVTTIHVFLRVLGTTYLSMISQFSCLWLPMSMENSIRGTRFLLYPRIGGSGRIHFFEIPRCGIGIFHGQQVEF